MCAAADDPAYSIEVSPAAARDLKQLAKHLDQAQLRSIDSKIQSLSRDPRPPGCDKLSGSDVIYRIRDGDYRILYGVFDPERRVEIARVRDRKDVYRF